MPMRLRSILTAGAFAPAALFIGLLTAPSATASEDVWAKMKQPGRIVLLRHSHAPETPTESYDIDVRNCKIQRNLDAAGRAQAARIGDAFRKHGIKRVRILSSQYCRTLETARLLKLGPVQELPLLNIVYFSQLTRMRDVSQQSVQHMKALPSMPHTVLVTHVGNIHGMTGAMLSSGEMAVVHFDASGALAMDGRIKVP
jgi:phosphohistidine phosphatase SixA